MSKSNWKFSAVPTEIDLARIVREASQAVDDGHEAIRLTIGRQVFTLATFSLYIKTCPMVLPLGCVTRLTKFVKDETGGLKVVGLCPVFASIGDDNVVIFNQDLCRKLRGGVEVNVEVF